MSNKKAYKSKVLAAIDWAIGTTKETLAIQREYPELLKNLKKLRQKIQESNITRLELTKLKQFVQATPPWGKVKGYNNSKNWLQANLKEAVKVRNVKWQHKFDLCESSLFVSNTSVFENLRSGLENWLALNNFNIKKNLAKIASNSNFDFKFRVKSVSSFANKIKRNSKNVGQPWTSWQFSDIIGVRAEWHTTQSFVEFVKLFEKQTDLDIVYKTDYVGRVNYNGINYIFWYNGELVELQTLTKTNTTGAQLQHQLTYQDTKKALSTTSKEKRLVRRVVNAAYWTSFKELVKRYD